MTPYPKIKMKNYLSFGGGVNSVAMYLLLMDQGMKPGEPDKGFEAVFVDHGTDWPETYEYVEMFKSKYPLTVLKPDVGTVEGKRFDNLYNYNYFKGLTPSIQYRSCTSKFKRVPINKYVLKPCFMMVGIDFGESHRASISLEKGIEKRYPLIEATTDRDGCKKLIKKHGLPVPPNSGCFICPFQKKAQWVELRKTHPKLFCKAEKLENKSRDRMKAKGQQLFYIKNKPLRVFVDENQSKLWEVDEYPPCECML